jgi:hypothetical protein
VLAAGEVDQPLGAVDEGGEQVRSDDVDRQDVRAGVDAGVVDYRVHPAQAVHLAGDTARLLEVGEVPDDGRSAPVQEVADGREPVAVASVDDDPVPSSSSVWAAARPRPSAEPVMKTRAISAEARGRPGSGYAGFVGHRLLVSINTTRARPWGNVGGRGHRRVRGRTAVPLIVICQCAAVRWVVAP